MIGLMLFILIGFGIALFSRYSTPGITFTIGDYQYSNVPLFALTVGTYLLGILLAWIVEVPESIATAFQIMGLGRSIKSGNNTIAQLQNKIKSLEIENIKLQERNHSIVANRQKDANCRPNIINNLLHRLNLR